MQGACKDWNNFLRIISLKNPRTGRLLNLLCRIIDNRFTIQGVRVRVVTKVSIFKWHTLYIFEFCESSLSNNFKYVLHTLRH